MSRCVSAALAAKLAGCSRPTFGPRYVDSGRVDIEVSPGGRVLIVLGSLERALDRTITDAEMAAADRGLQPLRIRQAEYRNRVEGGGRRRSQGEPSRVAVK